MDSFTTRPNEQWTVSSTTYQVGSSTRSFGNFNTTSQSAGNPYSSDTGGTTNGHTTQSANAESISSRAVDATSRTAFDFGLTYFRSQSDSLGSSTADSAGSGTSSTSAFTSAGGTTFSRITQNDTSYASSSGRSADGSFGITIDGSVTDTPGTVSTTTGTPAASTYTSSGTSTAFSTSAEDVYLSTITTGSSDGIAAVFTTASFSISTTTSTQASSSWTTTFSNLSSQSTTYTTDGTDTVTYQAAVTTALTATSHVRTNYAFGSILQDTVLLMVAGRGTGDVNRGEILWSFSNSSLASGTSTTGLFTDLYASSSAGTITVSDYRRFGSSSIAVTALSISVSSFSSVDGTDTVNYNLTSSNGTSFASTETRTTSHTSVASTVTMTSNLTTSYSSSWSLGAVGTSLSTGSFTTTTDTAQPASTTSSTLFTHTAFVSGYETTSSAWTSGTVTSIWGFATSGTSSRSIVLAPAQTTVALSTLATTSDSILFSSFTTTGTGTDTARVFLGSVSTITSRFSSVHSTFTRPVYLALYNSTAAQYVTTNEAGFGNQTITFSDSFNITHWSESRLFPHVVDRPGHDNIPPLNEVRHKCHPLGYAGFGGRFTVSDLAVYVTTSQGLAAGSEFTAATITPPSVTAEACRGVTFYPVGSTMRFGGLGGAASTSLISVPNGMESVLSIAATWTSTTGPTSASSITSRFATHTIGAVSGITGEFWSAEGFTVNSHFRSESPGDMSGGFVAGDNALGETYQVLARVGNARWTEFSSTQSTAGLTGATSGTAGSVSFTLPASHAVVFSLEPVLTASWGPVGAFSIFSSAAHNPFA